MAKNSQSKSKPYKTPQQGPTCVSEMTTVYHTPFQKATIARSGVSTPFVADLMDSLGLNKLETAQLIGVSLKTLDRHFQSGRLFKGLQSDRILELAGLYSQGVETFGAKEKFLKWLKSTSPALGNTMPKEWLDTQQGIQAVSDELGRIRHGVFA